MKTIYKLFTILFIGSILLPACEKALDMEQKMELSEELAFTSVIGLQTAVIGMYDRMQGGDLYGGNFQAAGDMLGDFVKKSGEGNIVYEETQMFDKNLTPDNRISASMWSNAYWIVNQANVILANIPAVTDPELTPAIKNRIEGECLFVRAAITFEILRYWGNPKTGLGVPLLTKPTGIIGDDAKPSRATIEACYTQIIADLNKAMDQLPETNSQRATKWAAAAYLSRVYFYKGDYPNCEIISTSVIESNKFDLVDSLPLNYLPEPGKETIFAIMSTKTDGSSGTLNGYYRKASGAKLSPSNDILKIFLFSGGDADKRKSQLLAFIGSKWFSTKYDDRYMSVPVIRLAEIYLNRAEARFNLYPTNPTLALADMNMVRTKRGLPAEMSLTFKKLEYERTKELYIEGDQFHNYRRLQKSSMSNYNLPYDDSRLMFKIPQREIDVNPNLVQN
ncbi:MAG: RagB/SusD family nutrient uptake outer membrane protein [Bacteroidales bacterium]|nr:RagB/SusD family nutrient uptake outer membrane protein [Bacteroidales bacterium]